MSTSSSACDLEANGATLSVSLSSPAKWYHSKGAKATVGVVGLLGALAVVGSSLSSTGRGTAAVPSFSSSPAVRARSLQASTTDPAYPIIVPTGNTLTGPISTDFLTRETFRKQFTQSTDFVVDIDNLAATAQNGGTVRGVDAGSFPALSGEGVAITVLEFAPCSINAPHVHPRATEMVYFIEGEQFLTTFVEENGGRKIENVVTAGMTTLFPMGLVHLVQNLSCNPAKIIAAFGGDNAGTLTLSTQGYTMLHDNEATAASLNLSVDALTALAAGFPANPLQDPVCLARCGLTAGAV